MIALATIDVDALRAYLLDHCGSAMMSGFPAAILDVADIERASGEQLCRMAERMGIDLRRFTVRS
jgi:hypothetical protein